MSLHAGQEKNFSWIQIIIANVTLESAPETICNNFMTAPFDIANFRFTITIETFFFGKTLLEGCIFL